MIKEGIHTRHRLTADYVAIMATLTVLLFAIIFPFYNVIVISLETSAAYARNPASLYPMGITLENYAYILRDGAVGIGYRSNLIVCAAGLVLGMGVTTPTAYAFSRRAFPGKKQLFMLMMFTMFFGGGLVPTYLMMKSMKLINTYTAVILLGGVSTTHIIVMKSGFESTPPALEEASKVDGANDLQIFFRVMLPLQKPLLATFSLFTVVGYWNDWY